MSERVITILTSSFKDILIPGIVYTIPLTIISFLIGLIIAVICALIKVYKVKILYPIVRFYVWVIRGTPLLVQLFIIFYGLPNLGIQLEAFPAAILAFSLNVGAYATETLRGSILSIDPLQNEAALSLGMTPLQAMRYVILPQAFKTALSPLFNSLISLVKDTSLASNITVVEMFMAAQRIAANTYEPLALYLEVAVIYLFFCTILNYLQNYIEKKLRIEVKA